MVRNEVETALGALIARNCGDCNYPGIDIILRCDGQRAAVGLG